MDSIKEETKKYGAGGNNDYFQFEEGVNKIRILTQPKVIAYHFFGKGQKPVVCTGIDEGCSYHKETDEKARIRLVTYVIDRKDGKIKLAELPLSISYSINDLQEDADFAFEEFPMPYDVKITHDPKNDDPKAKYRLVASPKQEPVTADEEEGLNKALEKMTPEQYVDTRKNKQVAQGNPVEEDSSKMEPPF